MSVDAIKLTTYFSERDRTTDGRFLADALFDVYERHEMRTSVLLRGIAGFGQHHQLQSDRLLTLSETLPVVSVAVDTRERVERALSDVFTVASHGLVSLERARMLETGEAPTEFEGGVKLTVYGGRAVREQGETGYVRAVDELRRAGASGATVLLAVDGTLHGERRRARFFARNAGVPLMLLTVGTPETFLTVLPVVAGLLEEPVITLERIQVCKSDGQLLGVPLIATTEDRSGLPMWQKLMVHCEEQARYDGHPLYLELLRRLQEASAAGATVLRGVRGFYAGHEPFADRMLSLRRNVPVTVVLVDTPSNIQRLWPVVDELTSSAGLVTSELVPALHAVTTGGG